MLQSNNNPVGYVYRTVMPAAAVVGLPYAAATAPLATVGSIVGAVAADVATDAASKAITGKTWSENATPVVGYTLGAEAYPSMFMGSKAGYNYSKLGRYTLNYLEPADYSGHLGQLFDVYTKPLYRRPPSFKNGRKPLWYNSFAKSYGEKAAEQRFQNGAIWAQIPESEVPRPMYVKNSKPNSYRMVEDGLNLKNDGTLRYPSSFEDDWPDRFTIGQVGGLHSNHEHVENLINGYEVKEFRDKQKLNPQWIFADKVKEILPYKSIPWRAAHYLGGINLSRLLGYKPFEIRQNYVIDSKKTIARPIYKDPDEIRSYFNK